MRAQTMSLDQLVAKYGLKKAQTCAIVNRKAWKHVKLDVEEARGM